MLDERVRDRIIAETRGNPLALLELPRGLTATELAGGFGLLGAHALSGRIEESYVRRLELAPRVTRGDCCWSRRPSRSAIRCSCWAHPSDSGSRCLRLTTTDGLLALEERVTFRHPLVRSAVYRTASGPERRAAHLALGGGDRSGRRSGSSCVASGRGGGGTRRGGRAGARALRRPGAGARWPRRRGSVPAARGRADRRPGAAHRPSARRRSSQPGGGRVRRERAGCWRRRRSGRWTSSSALAWTCCAPRPRTPRVAAALRRRCSFEPRRRSSRSIRSSRARRTSTRGARRCSPGSSRAPRACTRSRVTL